jgi:hypothetical protein
MYANPIATKMRLVACSIEVAKRAVFEFQKRSHLQPLEWPQVAASGRKWPQGAARASGRSGLLGIGLQMPVPIAPLLKT